METRDQDPVFASSLLRRRPSQDRSERSVLKIIDACSELLKEVTFDKITIEQIAARAEVQVGTVYLFFQEKLYILLCLLERSFLETTAAYEAVESKSLHLMDYLAFIRDRLEANWFKHSHVMDLFFTYRHHPAILPALRAMETSANQCVGRKVKQEYPQLSPLTIAIVSGLINSILTYGLDELVYSAERARASLRKEWHIVLCSYINSLKER